MQSREEKELSQLYEEKSSESFFAIVFFFPYACPCTIWVIDFVPLEYVQRSALYVSNQSSASWPRAKLGPKICFQWPALLLGSSSNRNN
jgi:hypothetical protein